MIAAIVWAVKTTSATKWFSVPWYVSRAVRDVRRAHQVFVVYTKTDSVNRSESAFDFFTW
jgi:hypothetical protein